MSKKLSEMTLEELWHLFPIILVEHQKNWKGWYIEEEKLLKKLIPQIKRINHIGSTSISSICAKPIIDILVEQPWFSDSVTDVPDGSYDTSAYDYYQATGVFSLDGKFNLRSTKYRDELPKIDSTRKLKFKILLDHNPPVNSIFHILGKNYICAKMTSTITNDGMSALKKGEFYQIVD